MKKFLGWGVAGFIALVLIGSCIDDGDNETPGAKSANKAPEKGSEPDANVLEGCPANSSDGFKSGWRAALTHARMFRRSLDSLRSGKADASTIKSQLLTYRKSLTDMAFEAKDSVSQAEKTRPKADLMKTNSTYEYHRGMVAGCDYALNKIVK